jgi:hypothetical protein
MDIERSTALNLALLLGGLLFLTAPLAAQPDVRPDRIELYVEGDWADRSAQPNLVYENLSTDEQTVFDTVRTSGEPVNYTADEAPDRLEPGDTTIELYNVQYEGSWYLLQSKRFTYSPDLVTQVLPRIVLAMGGLFAGLIGGYRQFA